MGKFDNTADLSDLNILIIDDALAASIQLDMVLQTLGVNEVSIFNSGRDAFAYLATGTHQVDFIFLNLAMPDLYGLDVIRALGSLPSVGAPVTLVPISSSDSKMPAAAMHLSSIAGVQVVGAPQKPFCHEQLQAILMLGKTAKARVPSPGAASDINHDEIVPWYQPPGPATTSKWRALSQKFCHSKAVIRFPLMSTGLHRMLLLRSTSMLPEIDRSV
jgi:CheY-like chemotaxis protein